MKKSGNISSALLFIMLFAGLVISSCSKSSNNNNGGKIDPSTIATSNLIAYFPFEDNGNDAISALTPTQSPNVTYVTGQRGKAYQGANGAFFLYDLPAASKLKTLKAFTVAMWFYGAPAPQEVVPVPGILQINGTTDPVWGNMVLTQDRMPATADTLNLKMVFHKEGVAWNNQFVGFANKAFVQNIWLHLAFTYDNATSKYMVYVNGNPLVLADDITIRWADAPEVSPRPPLGDLAFVDATQFAIGGWIKKILGGTDDFMGNFMGKMDELRIYDKGLTAADVKALFEAEVTQLP